MASRWKKLRGGKLCELYVVGKTNEGREGVVDENYAKYRCSRAVVLNIYDKCGNKVQQGVSIRDKKFIYRVGEEVVVANTNLSDDVCNIGIHYFKTREAAEAYEQNPPQNGVYKQWHLDTGQQFIESNYENGKLHGGYKKWWKGGQLWEVSHYENGKKHGDYKAWWENGQQWEVSHHEDGKLHGDCKRWYDNGQLGRERHYENGKLHGDYKEWYYNGERNVICHYKNGKLHGDYKEWDENGVLIRNDRYEHEKLV